jgi:hypothetical protein
LYRGIFGDDASQQVRPFRSRKLDIAHAYLGGLDRRIDGVINVNQTKAANRSGEPTGVQVIDDGAGNDCGIASEALSRKTDDSVWEFKGKKDNLNSTPCLSREV